MGRAVVARVAAFAPRAVPPESLLPGVVPTRPATAERAAAASLVEAADEATEPVVVHAPLATTVPAVVPHEVPPDDPTAPVPVAGAQVRVQTTRVEVVGVAARPTALRAGDARVAVRPIGLDRPIVAVEVVGAIGVAPPPPRAAAVAVGVGVAQALSRRPLADPEPPVVTEQGALRHRHEGAPAPPVVDVGSSDPEGHIRLFSWSPTATTKTSRTPLNEAQL